MPRAFFVPTNASSLGPKEVARASFAALAAAALAAAITLAAAAPALAASPIQCGKASWYALTSRTASGQMADPSSLSAAHRSFPFGTRVQVKNLRNGKSVTVTINDRGPFVAGRIIDVTKAAAKELGFLRQGVAPVEVRVEDIAETPPLIATPNCKASNR